MRAVVGAAAIAGALVFTSTAGAQTAPTLVDPKLEVRSVVAGLTQPVQLEFLKAHDFFVLEKSTGQVKRIKDGGAPEVVLDLPVNSASERGLLGIALDKGFKLNGWVYLFWSESTTGADSAVLGEVPLLGNRLDRFVWNGSTLTYDATLHRQPAYQADEGQPLRANHNGGVLRVGPDGKLYLIAGDRGRRGQLQNLFDG